MLGCALIALDAFIYYHYLFDMTLPNLIYFLLTNDDFSVSFFFMKKNKISLLVEIVFVVYANWWLFVVLQRSTSR